MKKPMMILFDYGQTLVNEQFFDGVKGTEAVLKYATKNKYNKSAEEVQDYANKLNRELGRFDPEKRHLFQVEVPNHMFTKYLYESQGIEIPLSPEEIDSVFWDAAGLFPVWYIGAIDLKYEPKEDVLTIENWKDMVERLKDGNN